MGCFILLLATLSKSAVPKMCKTSTHTMTKLNLVEQVLLGCFDVFFSMPHFRLLDYRLINNNNNNNVDYAGQQHLGNFAELSPRNISQFQSIATQLRNSPSSIKPFLDNSIAERKSTGKLVLAMVVTLSRHHIPSLFSGWLHSKSCDSHFM